MSEFEATPRTAHDYCSAMPDKEMINRYIEYLINQSESKDLQIRSLEIKIDELTVKITSLLEEKQKEGNRMEELIAELGSLNAELSKSSKKIAKLDEQLKSAKTESTVAGQTFNTANRPETYKSMGVNGSKIVHKSDRSRVPEGSRVIETSNFVLYSLEMSLVAHEYKILRVVEPDKKPVWKYYPKDGHPEQVMRFDGTKATPEFMQALAYEVYNEERDLRKPPQMDPGHGHDSEQAYFEEVAEEGKEAS